MVRLAVDFPPPCVAHSSTFIAWVVVLSPALIAGVLGATMGRGYALAGGLVLLLGGLAVLPMSIWNVQTHADEVPEGVTYAYRYVTAAYGLTALA